MPIGIEFLRVCFHTSSIVGPILGEQRIPGWVIRIRGRGRNRSVTCNRGALGVVFLVGAVTEAAIDMNEIFAKLNNLSYELFGVFIPGTLTLVVTAAWILLIGSSFRECGWLPDWALSVTSFASHLTTDVGSPVVFDIAVTAILAYFAGHGLFYLSKRPRMPELVTHSDHLTPVFRHVASPGHWAGFDVALTWEQFMPLARALLRSRGGFSLIPTYQAKYTLHRSLACLARCSARWAAATFALAFAASFFVQEARPNWWSLPPAFALVVTSFFFEPVFRRSHAYYWRYFGDTLLAEVHGALQRPAGSTHDQRA